MRRLAISAVALIVSLASAVAGDEKPEAKTAASVPREDLVPDPEWVPNTGDRAEVTRAEAPACPSIVAYDRYLASVKANDTAGLANLTKLPGGTPVLILRNFRPVKPPSRARVVDIDTYFRENLFAEAEPSYLDSPVEVRVLDGTAKGQVRVVPESFIVPLIPRPDPKGYIHVESPGPLGRRFYEFPALPRSTASTPPAIRAANLLRVGLKAEKSGDIAGAIACFHRLVKDHRELPEAKSAASRMEAMGIVRLPNGEYLYDPLAHIRQKKLPPKVSDKSADPSRRAATLLTTGKNLEKLKKVPAAIETYRRVAKEFAGTEPAREAEARIKALGAK